MKANYSEERCITIGNLNRGNSFSPNTIENMRQAALSRSIPILSCEAFLNMKNISKAILVYNFDYPVYGEFTSITEAAKTLGCDQKTIRRALQTKKKY
jgi:hypothetical protein